MQGLLLVAPLYIFPSSQVCGAGDTVWDNILEAWDNHIDWLHPPTAYGPKEGDNISYVCPFYRHFHLILQVLKRVGLGLPAGFLAGSNIATQRASISVYHRFSAY